jgi:hypothetical protein
MIVSLLLLLSAIVSADAQRAVDKAATTTISGKVTLGGKGVSGFVVGLAIATPSSSTYVTRLKAVTDEDGKYRIKNVPPGSYQVLLSAADYVQSDRTSLVVGKNEVVENIDIALIRGGVITGKVIDVDGRPIVEEEVFFSSSTPSRGLPYMRRILTDDRGVYRAFGLPPGRYTVAAGKDSISTFGRAAGGHQRTYHPSTLNATEAAAIEVSEGSESTDVDITLSRELVKYAARGRIIDGDTSQPLPNRHIGIQLFFDADGATGSTSSGTAAESTKNGEFKIENLPPGKYAVYLDSQSDSEGLSEPVRFEVIDQDIEGLIIKTSKGGLVSGVVVLEGTQDPTIRALLTGDQIFAFVSNEFNGRTPPSANINPNGSFRLTGLPAGRLMLQLRQVRNGLQLVRIERDGVVYPGVIEIKEREQITGLRVIVSQANGKIRGVLKLPEGFELSAPARLIVLVRRTDDPMVYNSAVEVDARGQFLSEGLVAGTYELNAAIAGIPGDQRLRILRPAQTVVVTNGAIADVTLTVQMPKTGP